MATLNLSDFDYELPERLIAQTPLTDRAASRLMWVHRDGSGVTHHKFTDALSILESGDLLVMNDTRVSALRIFGRKATGAEVEALLLRDGMEPGTFVALMKPGRRLQPRTLVRFEAGLEATVESDLSDGQKLLRFTKTEGLGSALSEIGQAPLPPYIHTTLRDRDRYQTVYSATPGSSAAPTAGLHFTQEILDQLRNKGIQTATVTLDVGLDTFRPVQTEKLEDHQMHGERCSVPPETAEAIAQCRGRLIAVGTTTVRTLEGFAIGPRQVEPGEKVNKIFITPGREFQVVDGMFTNFHMPRTTMLMMISAMVNPAIIRGAYAEAVREQYRFLSFGDSMLIL